MQGAFLIELIVSVLSGGATGYLTNALAVSMLFKKYGPWGGVIERRYAEFIGNMSDLVETDLINAATLRPEFTAPSFKALLEKLIQQTLNGAAPGPARFQDIPGAEKSAEGLIALLRPLEADFLQDCFDALGEIKTGDIISADQQEHCVQKIADHAQRLLNQSPLQFDVPDSKHYSAELLAAATDFFSAEEGRHLLGELCAALLREAGKIDASFADILAPEAPKGIAAFVERKTPGIIDAFCGFIRCNESEIESMLGDTIDEILQSNPLGMFLKSIKDKFAGNIAGNFKLADGIINYLNLHKIEISKKASLVCFDFMQTYPIGKIFSVINEKTAANGIIAYLEKLRRDKIDITELLLQKSLTPVLMCAANLFRETATKKLSDVPVASFLPFALNHVHIDFEALWQKNKTRPISEAWSALQNDDVYAKLACAVFESIDQNAAALLSGNVSRLVNIELEKSKPAEINAMLQDFMGKELKPINVFGGFLGALAGALTVFAVSRFNIPHSFVWQLIPAYAAVFALVGIATNAIAIKMLFRPYTGLSGLNFSPFVGVVAAQKPRFAKTLAQLIKDRILGEQSLKNLFAKNRTTIVEKAQDYLRKTNFAAAGAALASPSRLESIAQFVGRSIQAYITTHRSDVSNYLADTALDALREGKLTPLVPAISSALVNKLKDADAGAFLHADAIPFAKIGVALLASSCKPETTLRHVFNGAIPKWINKNINVLIDILLEAISKCVNGLAEKMPFAQNMIHKAIDILTKEKIPAFLRKNQNDLGAILDSILDCSLADLGFTGNSFKTEKIEALLNNIFNAPPVQKSLSGLFEDPKLKQIVQSWSSHLFHDPAVLQALTTFMQKTLEQALQDKDCCNETILRRDIDRFALNIINTESIMTKLRLAAEAPLQKILSGAGAALDTETKDAICVDYLLRAVLDTLEDNFDAIIAAINVQGVVEREVLAMHPRQIETLFYKFAGRYFAKITFYGWIGAFGGIASYLISLVLAYFGSR